MRRASLLLLILSLLLPLSISQKVIPAPCIYDAESITFTVYTPQTGNVPAKLNYGLWSTEDGVGYNGYFVLTVSLPEEEPTHSNWFARALGRGGNDDNRKRPLFAGQPQIHLNITGSLGCAMQKLLLISIDTCYQTMYNVPDLCSWALDFIGGMYQYSVEQEGDGTIAIIVPKWFNSDAPFTMYSQSTSCNPFYNCSTSCNTNLFTNLYGGSANITDSQVQLSGGTNATFDGSSVTVENSYNFTFSNQNSSAPLNLTLYNSTQVTVDAEPSEVTINIYSFNRSACAYSADWKSLTPPTNQTTSVFPTFSPLTLDGGGNLFTQGNWLLVGDNQLNYTGEFEQRFFFHYCSEKVAVYSSSSSTNQSIQLNLFNVTSGVGVPIDGDATAVSRVEPLSPGSSLSSSCAAISGILVQPNDSFSLYLSSSNSGITLAKNALFSLVALADGCVSGPSSNTTNNVTINVNVTVNGTEIKAGNCTAIYSNTTDGAFYIENLGLCDAVPKEENYPETCFYFDIEGSTLVANYDGICAADANYGTPRSGYIHFINSATITASNVGQNFSFSTIQPKLSFEAERCASVSGPDGDGVVTLSGTGLCSIVTDSTCMGVDVTEEGNVTVSFTGVCSVDANMGIARDGAIHLMNTSTIGVYNPIGTSSFFLTATVPTVFTGDLCLGVDQSGDSVEFDFTGLCSLISTSSAIDVEFDSGTGVASLSFSGVTAIRGPATNTYRTGEITLGSTPTVTVVEVTPGSYEFQATGDISIDVAQCLSKEVESSDGTILLTNTGVCGISVQSATLSEVERNESSSSHAGEGLIEHAWHSLGGSKKPSAKKNKLVQDTLTDTVTFIDAANIQPRTTSDNQIEWNFVCPINCGDESINTNSTCNCQGGVTTTGDITSSGTCSCTEISTTTITTTEIISPSGLPISFPTGISLPPPTSVTLTFDPNDPSISSISSTSGSPSTPGHSTGLPSLPGGGGCSPVHLGLSQSYLIGKDRHGRSIKVIGSVLHSASHAVSSAASSATHEATAVASAVVSVLGGILCSGAGVPVPTSGFGSAPHIPGGPSIGPDPFPSSLTGAIAEAAFAAGSSPSPSTGEPPTAEAAAEAAANAATSGSPLPASSPVTITVWSGGLSIPIANNSSPIPPCNSLYEGLTFVVQSNGTTDDEWIICLNIPSQDGYAWYPVSLLTALITDTIPGGNGTTIECDPTFCDIETSANLTVKTITAATKVLGGNCTFCSLSVNQYGYVTAFDSGNVTLYNGSVSYVQSITYYSGAGIVMDNDSMIVNQGYTILNQTLVNDLNVTGSLLMCYASNDTLQAAVFEGCGGTTAQFPSGANITGGTLNNVTYISNSGTTHLGGTTNITGPLYVNGALFDPTTQELIAGSNIVLTTGSSSTTISTSSNPTFSSVNLLNTHGSYAAMEASGTHSQPSATIQTFNVPGRLLAQGELEIPQFDDSSGQPTFYPPDSADNGAYLYLGNYTGLLWSYSFQGWTPSGAYQFEGTTNQVCATEGGGFGHPSVTYGLCSSVVFPGSASVCQSGATLTANSFSSCSGSAASFPAGATFAGTVTMDNTLFMNDDIIMTGQLRMTSASAGINVQGGIVNSINGYSGGTGSGGLPALFPYGLIDSTFSSSLSVYETQTISNLQVQFVSSSGFSCNGGPGSNSASFTLKLYRTYQSKSWFISSPTSLTITLNSGNTCMQGIIVTAGTSTVFTIPSDFDPSASFVNRFSNIGVTNSTSTYPFLFQYGLLNPGSGYVFNLIEPPDLTSGWPVGTYDLYNLINGFIYT